MSEQASQRPSRDGEDRDRHPLAMETLVSLCASRGFIFAASEIYGGIAGFWDYGPLGVELKNNLKAVWWSRMVRERDDVVGIDSAIICHPRTWEASGHVEHFSDPMVDCRTCKRRFRADQIGDERCPEAPAKRAVRECDLTEARDFNLMLRTEIGASVEDATTAYLRPETCQPIFSGFKRVREAARQKVPFGIAQIGKAFRNEITPRNFTFRSREFEQAEMEFFCHPSERERWFAHWLDYRRQFHRDIGFSDDLLRIRPHAQDELAHYARAASDIEFLFPFGWQEIEGIHDRGDWDLTRHTQYAGKELAITDEETKERYTPMVIETSVGVDRTALALLVAAYAEEKLPDGETRTVMRFKPAIAPIKAAVLPLSKKLAEPALAIQKSLRKFFNTFYDEAGNIGRRYRRQDEVGTPFCVTYDFDSENDHSVTVRERDSMSQVRVPVEGIVRYLRDRLEEGLWSARKQGQSKKKAATGARARAGVARERAAASRAKSPKAAKRAAPRKSNTARKNPTQRKVFFFGGGHADGDASMKTILGGKGANLAEMTSLGIPVPPGFTISTDVCAEFNERGKKLPPEVRADVLTALANVEQEMGLRFGDKDRPLLVSVRSGARASMPGMMDTVLNLGLNDETVQGLARMAGERFAFDSYRRFIQMFGDVVLGVPHDRFEHRLDAAKEERHVRDDVDLTADDLKRIVADYLEIVKETTGQSFPQDPKSQLWGAIGAVFSSWENQRAIAYRRLNDIPDHWGTAVNVQSMVFGNMGNDCATGVAFTRNPSTGERSFYGEYLKNAQGEDVVAGIRTPQPINEASRAEDTKSLPTLEQEMPKAYRELVAIYKRLERHYRDMQDIEFTIQQGKLWMLQTRNGKRTAAAAVRIAVEMAREKLITKDEAILRVDANALDQLLHPTIDKSQAPPVIARGLPASPGAAVGEVVFSADQAELRAKGGAKVILVRNETSPEDIVGMHASQGILTAKGGMTSHAAVVARGMGKSCVAGCSSLAINYAQGTMRIGDHVVREGDWITIDGSSGEVMLGKAATVVPELGGAFSDLMKWSDKVRKLRVRTNADTPQDARVARGFGAEGIGLCRTEHMFFEPGRILAVREMILASDTPAREAALAKLRPMQRGDFESIFRAMDGLPVTVRLLDPPLHEFLPQTEEDIKAVAEALHRSVGDVRHKLENLHEFNPMLGHRGCRLGVTFPEIYAMQARAITEAACRVAEEKVKVKPEIMIPLVAHARELERLRRLVEKTVAEVRAEFPGTSVRPTIGTMIEVPRAALTADEIAHHADFFSFGTNDLTQMGYALSRDDAGNFLPFYVDAGIIPADPFVSIDEGGVGQLVRLGVARGRETRPDLKVGVCGEHGGDPASVRFFAEVGLDYVSCSPYRVPLARLAAAQAAVVLGRSA